MSCLPTELAQPNIKEIIFFRQLEITRQNIRLKKCSQWFSRKFLFLGTLIMLFPTLPSPFPFPSFPISFSAPLPSHHPSRPLPSPIPLFPVSPLPYRPLKSSLGPVWVRSGADPQRKSNLVHFSLKIWNLVQQFQWFSWEPIDHLTKFRP